MQMWTLAPLVIGHWILEDDKHWENFFWISSLLTTLLVEHVVTWELLMMTTILPLSHAPITMKMHSIIHMRLILEQVLT